MSRVFALTPTNYDITEAAGYGEIVYLYNAPNTRKLPYGFVEDFALDVWRRMKDNGYDPDKDFLLVVGPQVLVVQWVAAVISQKQYCRCLLYEAPKSRYVSRILGFSVDPDETEESLKRQLVESSEDGQRRIRSVPV